VALAVRGNEGDIEWWIEIGPSADESPRPPDPRAAAHALARRVPVVVPSGGEPLEVGEALAGGRPEARFCSVAVPLRIPGTHAAALCFFRGERDAYEPDDLVLLVDSGDRIAQMLDHLEVKRELGAQRQIKADFLSLLSHELRNPLTAVVGYADLLEAGIPGPVTEKQRGQLVRIKDSAWELLSLIDQMLARVREDAPRDDLVAPPWAVDRRPAVWHRVGRGD
jgi:signal transduction histidine kinase